MFIFKKLDPTQFLRVYGRPVKINLDPGVAQAAESPQSMSVFAYDMYKINQMKFAVLKTLYNNAHLKIKKLN